MSKRLYTKAGRLADVLALVQVLALDADIHRSETGIKKELKGKPISGEEWTPLAKEHPEFFHVDDEHEHALSLIARHVLPHAPQQPRASLSPEFTAVLLKAAVDLHDRLVSASEWWKSLMPLVGVLVGGFLGLPPTFLARHPAPPVGRFVQVEGTAGSILINSGTGRLCYSTAKGVKSDDPIPVCGDQH
jgi:hypothetical protein